jgi:hypothetical protein
MKRNRRQRPEQPKAIAIAVYAAANRGKYSLVGGATTLRAFTKFNRLFMTLRLCSPKFERDVWNAMTR